jgi:hypothetical protein
MLSLPLSHRGEQRDEDERQDSKSREEGHRDIRQWRFETVVFFRRVMAGTDRSGRRDAE